MSAIINPQAGAATALWAFNLIDLPARIAAPGLAGAETVTISAAEGDGTLLAVCTDLDGNPIKLTKDVKVVSITAPGLYHFAKDATASAVGVFERSST